MDAGAKTCIHVHPDAIALGRLSSQAQSHLDSPPRSSRFSKRPSPSVWDLSSLLLALLATHTSLDRPPILTTMAEAIQQLILDTLDKEGTIKDTRTLVLPGYKDPAATHDSQIIILGALNSLSSRDVHNFSGNVVLRPINILLR